MMKKTSKILAAATAAVFVLNGTVFAEQEGTVPDTAVMDDAAETGWSAEGKFIDDSADHLLLYHMRIEDGYDEEGWSVTVILGDVMYGGMLQEEEGSISGMIGSYEEDMTPGAEFMITLTEEDGQVFMQTEDGEEYRFSPDETDYTEGVEILPYFQYNQLYGMEGFDAVEAAAYDYLSFEKESDYAPEDVMIPYVNIIGIDESDPEDVLLYGDYYLWEFEKEDDTLVAIAGGHCPGIIHAQRFGDEGDEIAIYSATGMEEAFTDDDAETLFGDYFDAYQSVSSDQEKRDEGLAQVIADYVSANALNITGYRISDEETRVLPESHAGQTEEMDEAQVASETGIDYMALVNKLNPLPDGWEDALETVTITNSVGDAVEVEAKAYDAYELLRADLEENDGIYIELDSARRSIAAQQDIMDRFIEKYGADYAAKTVATPGYSEHHTGLAVDLYFRLKSEDGEFTDVYYNEDMVQYPEVWEKIHAKLADYGFILRYLDGREHITGYGYEPWHIRYVDDVDIAKGIMEEDITLEEYLGDYRAPAVEIDYGKSELYTQEEFQEAAIQIKCSFATWEGCELHSLRYTGDDANNEENLDWLNSLNEEAGYTQVAGFLGDFHSPAEEAGAWEPDEEYTDYQWWLARTEDGGWEIVTWGY